MKKKKQNILLEKLSNLATPVKSKLNLIIIFSIIIIDRLIKYVAVNSSQKQLLPFLNFIYVENEGMAFGMLKELGYSNVLLSVVTILAILLLMYMYSSYEMDKKMKVGIILMISGAIGNLLDRFLHGFVIDMFDFFIGGWHFATFNFADACISVGAFLVIIFMFASEYENRIGSKKAN